MAGDEWSACPICDAKVKAVNVSRHISRVHEDDELAEEFAVPSPEPSRAAMSGGRWKLVAFGVVTVLFVAGLALALTPSGPGNSSGGSGSGPSGLVEGLAVGNLAPDFTLTELDGPQFTLSQFRGKPVVLNFMAAWCTTCIPEAKNTKAVFGEYSSKGVVFITVDFDPYTDTASALRQYRADYGGGPGHIFAFDNPEEGVALRYGATFGSTWIIDQSGVIVFTDRQVTSSSTFAAQLDRLV
jgi:peroxiredoxin